MRLLKAGMSSKGYRISKSSVERVYPVKCRIMLNPQTLTTSAPPLLTATMLGDVLVMDGGLGPV